MAVTREPEVEREGREIVGALELDEGSSQPQLREVLVQRNPFDAAKDVGEIGG